MIIIGYLSRTFFLFYLRYLWSWSRGEYVNESRNLKKYFIINSLFLWIFTFSLKNYQIAFKERSIIISLANNKLKTNRWISSKGVCYERMFGNNSANVTDGLHKMSEFSLFWTLPKAMLAHVQYYTYYTYILVYNFILCMLLESYRMIISWSSTNAR